MFNPNTCFKLFVMLSQITMTFYVINIEQDLQALLEQQLELTTTGTDSNSISSSR